MRDDALTARIAAIKQRLLVGGLLMEVEWQRRTGVKDVRGRQAVDTTLLDVLIEQRPALDRGPGAPTGPTIRWWSFSTPWRLPMNTFSDGAIRFTPTQSKAYPVSFRMN